MRVLRNELRTSRLLSKTFDKPISAQLRNRPSMKPLRRCAAISTRSFKRKSTAEVSSNLIPQVCLLSPEKSSKSCKTFGFSSCQCVVMFRSHQILGALSPSYLHRLHISRVSFSVSWRLRDQRHTVPRRSRRRAGKPLRRRIPPRCVKIKETNEVML